MTYRCEAYGYVIVPRAEFFAGPKIECYAGAPNRTSEELDAMHAEQNALALERIKDVPGAYVGYTRDADAEGFMIVGDDPNEIDRTICAEEEELASIVAAERASMAATTPASEGEHP